jgi:ferrous iron transport protein B
MNVGITMIEKAKIFVTDAGKVIMVISLLLWFLSSYGPGNNLKNIETKYAALTTANPTAKDSLSKAASTEKLKHSYAGILGKQIEPIIEAFGLRLENWYCINYIICCKRSFCRNNGYLI